MKGVRELSRFMMPMLLGGILACGIGFVGSGSQAFALMRGPAPSPDFTMSGATATILQDTDTCGVTAGDPPNIESCESAANSDAFAISARLRFRGASDFLTDLRGNDVFIYLAPGTCSSLDLTSVRSFPDGTFTTVVPAGSLTTGASFQGKTYTFKGSVPDRTNVAVFDVQPEVRALADRYGALEFTVTTPWFIDPRATANGSVSVQGNANLCAMTGPMAFVLSLGQPLTPENDSDSASDAAASDVACVDVPAPTIHDLDLTALTCEAVAAPME
ncbi:MAG: hypothetical protein ACREP6_00155 [Candidatus Binataceae bacterium]